MAKGQRKLKDETGNVYGDLTVLREGPPRITKGGVTVTWVCECSCGRETDPIRGYDLRSGKQVRCGDCAKQARKRPRKGLYVMKAGPFIKIGSSDSVSQRLRTIQDCCPYEVEVIFWDEARGHEELDWHDKYWDHRQRGEWFSDSIEEDLIGSLES